MKKLFVLSFVCSFTLMLMGAKNPPVDPNYSFIVRDPNSNYIQILFAGDAMQHAPQIQMAYNAQTKKYNYEPNFRYIRPYVSKADIAIVNFETTLSGEPYAGYPKFRAPDAYFTELCETGFQVFALANNHILDGGQKGLERTLNTMGSVAHLGAYRDTAYRAKEYPLILHIDGKKIALFNATYGTNQIIPTHPNYVNYIETEELLLDMEKSKKDSTIDLRIMFIHWGDEYQLRHNPLQQGVAQWLADLGFDLIIGSHPHVVQDQEILISEDGRNVPVVYSLGNFISNQRRLNTNGGIMVAVNINRQTAKIEEVEYIPVYVHKGKLGTENNYFCIPTFDYLDGNLPIKIESDSLANDLKLFHDNTMKRMGNTLNVPPTRSFIFEELDL